MTAKAAKFQPGDLARIGGLHRPVPAYVRWHTRRGRIVKIQAIADRTPAGHLVYKIAGRKCKGDLFLASYDLRRPNERLRAPGAGHPSSRATGTV